MTLPRKSWYHAMSTLTDSCDMNDARPLRTVQDGAASGSVPQRSPPSATGGPTRPPCHARGPGRKATGSTSTSTRTRHFQVMHWRQNWSISCTRGASRSVATRNPTHRAANPLRSEATSASGQTERTEHSRNF